MESHLQCIESPKISNHNEWLSILTKTTIQINIGKIYYIQRKLKTIFLKPLASLAFTDFIVSHHRIAAHAFS